MRCIAGQDDAADTIPLRRALVHTIRGCSFELVVALAGQYRLIAGVLFAFDTPLPEGEPAPF